VLSEHRKKQPFPHFKHIQTYTYIHKNIQIHILSKMTQQNRPKTNLTLNNSFTKISKQKSEKNPPTKEIHQRKKSTNYRKPETHTLLHLPNIYLGGLGVGG
jgi:hypothetical protein